MSHSNPKFWKIGLGSNLDIVSNVQPILRIAALEDIIMSQAC